MLNQAPKEHFLRVENLSIFIGKKKPKKISGPIGFQLCAQDVVLFQGPSGAGKSIAMKAIGGLLPREFLVSGSIDRKTPIVYIHQQAAGSFPPRATVLDHLRAVQARHKSPRSRLGDLLLRFDLSESPEWLDRYPAQFSGGNLQRLALIAGLLTEARVILADEVLSELDSIHQIQVLEHMLEIVETENKALVLSTHDLRLTSWAKEVVEFSENSQESHPQV